MKREMELLEIANIRFGINAKALVNEAIPIIQGKDLDANGKIGHYSLYKVKDDNIREWDYLAAGEVLFAGKGSRNYAVVWQGDVKPAVASSTFFRLRPVNGSVLPEYLAWFLNSPQAQNYFRKHIRATTIFTISKKVFEHLAVPVPSLEVQRKIVRLNELRKEERDIYASCIEKREQLIDYATNKFLNR